MADEKELTELEEAQLTKFIIENGRVKLKTRDWYLRQFTDAEHEESYSAGRIAADKIRDNPRLRAIGDIEKEVDRRQTGAYVMYMLPLLVIDKDGKNVFDVSSNKSMQEFERLPNDVFKEMVGLFWDHIFAAWELSSKNESRPVSSEE